MTACSWTPVEDRPVQGTQRTSPNLPSQTVVRLAKAQLGIPYRYGGSNPKQGFDCSGLVYYTHNKAGVDVPRTSEQQYRAATPVASGDLKPGDLLFYRTNGRLVSHVGIYVGNRQFIHAPNRKGAVRFAKIDEKFWTQRFVGAGRFTQ